MISIFSNICTLCPRACRADRQTGTGFCGVGEKPVVARAALHFGEEPPISGKSGSGTVFFSGCTLRCCYCQNAKISTDNYGAEISVARLSEIFKELEAQGAHNINLVTGTPHTYSIIKALELAKPEIPVVWNTGGYETAETLKLLDGYIDIYLTDIKYMDNATAKKYSAAPNYFEYAASTAETAIRQTGKPVFDADGIMQSGVIIRHLVLPGMRRDSMNIMQWLADNFEPDSFLLSLMSQYTPPANIKHRELARRLTTFEYQSVVDKALSIGLDNGFIQERSSATFEYTPDFDLTGV